MSSRDLRFYWAASGKCRETPSDTIPELAELIGVTERGHLAVNLVNTRTTAGIAALAVNIHPRQRRLTC